MTLYSSGTAFYRDEGYEEPVMCGCRSNDWGFDFNVHEYRCRCCESYLPEKSCASDS